MVRTRVCVLLVLSLLGEAFSAPLDIRMRRRIGDNEVETSERDLTAASSENRVTRQEDSSNSLDSPKDDTAAEADSPSRVSVESSTKPEFASPAPLDSDEDDDFDEPIAPAPSAGGGSNIFSLLKLANAFFPSSSGANGGDTKSAGETASPLWTLKMDILRALLQFGTSVLGSASSSSSSASIG